MSDYLNDHFAPQSVSRRDMLKVSLGTGGALFVAFGLPSLVKHFQTELNGRAPSLITQAKAETAPFAPNAFIRIAPDALRRDGPGHLHLDPDADRGRA